MSSNERKFHQSCRSVSSAPKNNNKHPAIRRYNSEQQIVTKNASQQQNSEIRAGSSTPRQYSNRTSSSNSTSEENFPKELEFGHVMDSPAPVFESPREESPQSFFQFEDAYNSDVTNGHSTIISSSDSTLPYSEGNFEEAERLFVEAVDRHAREVAGETQDPIDLDHPISKVKLELSSEQGMPLADTFGQRRSGATVRAPRGNVKLEDIFALAVRNATKEAKSKSLGRATERYVWEHGNRVLVTGQAGIGKSTLTREVVQKILDKHILPNTRYIFYIKCRDIDFDEKLNLLDFLLKYSVSENIEFHAQEKSRLIKSIDGSSEVVILFDGMDEAHTGDLTKSGAPKCLPKDSVQISVIVRCLMSGKLLPRAKVVVTCRPRQAFQLSPEYRPGAVVQIMGLNTHSQKMLGQQICGKNFTSTYHIIQRDPDLESACYVTVFCMILYAVLHEANTHKHGAKLNTITRVLIYLLDKYLRSAHMRDVEMDELRKIARLARNGFYKRQLVFDQSDITVAGITSAAFQAFMVTYLDKDTKLRYRIFEGEHRCSFSHQIWQEFFTAMDLMFFASPKDFEECQDYLTNNSRWEIVSKFMYGLTNAENILFVQHQFLSKSFHSDWQQRKDILRTSAELCIRKQTQDCMLLMQVCNWIQEADDYSFTRNVANRLPQTFKVAGSNSPLILFNHDVQSIVRLLNTASDFVEENPVKSIDFELVEFTGESFRHFAGGISNVKGRFREIRLIECGLGNASGGQIARFMNKVDRLHIAYCDIKPVGIAVMKEQYARLPNPRPEVWVFDQDSTPCDFSYDLRQRNT